VEQEAIYEAGNLLATLQAGFTTGIPSRRRWTKPYVMRLMQVRSRAAGADVDSSDPR
jgi:hypothetical protein